MFESPKRHHSFCIEPRRGLVRKKRISQFYKILRALLIAAIVGILPLGCDDGKAKDGSPQVNHSSSHNPYLVPVSGHGAHNGTGRDMATIRVKNAAALTNALRTVRGGDTLVLAPGDYNDVTITRQNFSTAVTIVSANVTRMAHIDGISITGSSGIVFRSLDIGQGLLPGQPDYTQLVSLNNTQNVTFDRVNLHGAVDGNAANDGHGIKIADSTNIQIVNSDFNDLYKGVTAHRSNNLSLLNNDFTDIRIDAIAMVATSDVVIDRNRFSNFHPLADDHSDAIQFGTSGSTTASTNITITNNVMTQGTGDGFQGIFITDQIGLAYRNINILNNTLNVNQSYNGITVENAANVNIINNIVKSIAGDDFIYRIRLTDINNGVLQGNTTDRIVINNLIDVDVLENMESDAYSAKITEIDAIDQKKLQSVVNEILFHSDSDDYFSTNSILAHSSNFNSPIDQNSPIGQSAPIDLGLALGGGPEMSSTSFISLESLLGGMTPIIG